MAGGGRIVVNEQKPVPDADFGLAETAVHIVLPRCLSDQVRSEGRRAAQGCCHGSAPCSRVSGGITPLQAEANGGRLQARSEWA
ncbi:hypothetical protein Amsp01_079420 [Amycolatopsis sp. NBRC 101858]|nr:hypothetical protein Amsp01_079420 [Amycolatopsis sp. NBRC 101858]